MEALYYEKKPANAIHCMLCPHHCLIPPGHCGRCHTRYNDAGILLALNYGQCTSMALDPVEKKPLQRFHPGSFILSLGSWGCNFHCSFCQNWQISQDIPSYEEISPQDAVRLAIQLKKRGNIGIAYTYNEPIIWYEFLRQTAPLIHKAGLYNVVVTNGFIEEAPLRELLPLIDAWNIDIKSFDENFYLRRCKGALSPVKRTIALAAAAAHVEVTTLLIPGENDKIEEIEKTAHWLSKIDSQIPFHLTRYFPQYKMSLPATPISTLRSGAAAAKKWLDYVYIGNVPDDDLDQV